MPAKLFDQSRLADAGLTNDQDKFALAREGSLRRASEHREFFLAADKTREKLSLSPTASAARAHDAIEFHWRGSALKLVEALVLNDEQPSDLPLDGRSDEHRSGLRCSLNTRGDVGRFAEHVAVVVDNDRTPFEANADGEPGSAASSVSGVQVSERLLDSESRHHGALGVVFLRLRIAEDGHQPVAKPLHHMAAEPGDGLRGLVQIGADQIAPVLNVERSGEFGRADQIAEHDCDRTSFSGIELREGLRSSSELAPAVWLPS